MSRGINGEQFLIDGYASRIREVMALRQMLDGYDAVRHAKYAVWTSVISSVIALVTGTAAVVVAVLK